MGIGDAASRRVRAGELMRSVGLDPALPCGRCRECGSGLEHLCTRMHFAGHGDTETGRDGRVGEDG